MLIKAVGMIILVTSGTMIGFLKAKQLSGRVDFLEEYISLLTYIETQVRYSYECVTDILVHYEDSERLSFIGDCVDKTLNGEIFSEAWRSSVSNIPIDRGLKNEDINLIRGFGKEFGLSDIEGQIAHCKLHKQLMQDRLNDARIQKQKKSRLYQMLGASLGLCIGLLFI